MHLRNPSQKDNESRSVANSLTGSGQAIQRVVYIDPQYNSTKIPNIKAAKLHTKATLAAMLGVAKLTTKDDRHNYLFKGDPRIPLVVAHTVDYIKNNYTVLDEEQVKKATLARLTAHAEDAGEYSLDSEVEGLVNQLTAEGHIGAKERPSVGLKANQGYTDFIASSYDEAERTPGGIIKSHKENVTSSFTEQGQQVNTIAFLNKTPIGVFHNKYRDRLVVSKLKEEGYTVPRFVEGSGVHSHSEDEVIYEILFGNLKTLVEEQIKRDQNITITFMISDLTCNYNQITSKEQRSVRSCAENIVRFARTLKAKGKSVQVQVIYARPYGLNYYNQPESAHHELGIKAKEALDIFHTNGIRARAIHNFFGPDQRKDIKVLADPEAYKIKEPGTPERFDPSDTPFPALSAKRPRDEKEKEKGSDTVKRQRWSTRDIYADGVIPLDGQRLFDDFYHEGGVTVLNNYQTGLLIELLGGDPKDKLVGVGGVTYKVLCHPTKKVLPTKANPGGLMLGLKKHLYGG